MRRDDFARLAQARLALERGRIDKQAPLTLALAYPSPYRVGMSSLGYQQIYRLLQAEPEMAVERVFLPDDAGTGLLDDEPLSLESLRPLSAFPVVALSVAYELELAGLVQLLEAAQIPALRSERGATHPLIVAGGPLTFSNPLPLGAFADIVVMGEADALAVTLLREALTSRDKEQALAKLAAMPNVFVPAVHAELPPIAQADDGLLPARSQIRTPDTELSDMFLIEAERGCSRGCTYCVMRRSTNGGMRLVPADELLALIPQEDKRVGLVGAAVSDHPDIVRIVGDLVARGTEVGLSSLRPDKLSDAFVAVLKTAGYRTLTTAMDGPSERMREVLDRRARTRHLIAAAERARAHSIPRLKLYLMLGVPGETEADIDECVALTTELSRIVPTSLAVAPFCAKRNTPLDGQPFAGIKTVDRHIARLRKGLRGRAEVRATSARWAWVEYVLAQGGLPEGRAVHVAVRNGGRFADYRRAFAERDEVTTRKKLFIVRDTPDDSARRTERWLTPT